MAQTNQQGENVGGTGNTVDSLQVVSNGQAAYANNGGRVNDEEECYRSHRTITTSLLMFLFYLLTMLCTWIGLVDYLNETYDRYSLDYYDSDSNEWVEEEQEYAYPFLISNLLFTIALFIEIWVWHTKC